MKILASLKEYLRPRGKLAFIASIKNSAKILDVGCGNDSSFLIKSKVPDCFYVGIDIGDYNQKKPNLADKYILTSPDLFSQEIQKFREQFNVVISSHNIEHCNDRVATIIAMLNSLEIGGNIYISFPCSDSVSFPSRGGTLNYFDDLTHKPPPPNYDHILELLKKCNFDVDFSERNYKPIVLRIIGAILEPFSKISKRVLIGTWEFYGFESIIWATKKAL